MDFDLKLVTVEDSYIEFLKQYQIDILPNRKEKSRHRRLYVCLNIGDILYSIPLCSPKESDYYRGGAKKDSLPIIRLVDKNTDLLATLRLSHMIIVPRNSMNYFDISKERDIRYRELVTKEYHIIKSKQDRIRKNASVLIKQKLHQDDYFLFGNNDIPVYLQKTLDFKFINEMSQEYAPALNQNYGYEQKEEIVYEEPPKVDDDMGFVMLDKIPKQEVYHHTEEKAFSLEEEMQTLRQIVNESKKEEPIPEVKVEEFRYEPAEPKYQPEEPKYEPKRVVIEEPAPVVQEIEVKSAKMILVALRAIHSGNSSVDILLGSYFKYRDITYQILEYDPKTLYALLKNCKSNDIMLVSNFPLDEQCGWERPINFGNQEDSLKRGRKIYNGFIK